MKKFFAAALALLLAACSGGPAQPAKAQTKGDTSVSQPLPEGLETATLGAGCFWCVEAIFQDLKGIHQVESGYSGGHVENPTYKAVCSETTGHAEVIQVHFDPKQISFAEILEVFWRVHDPTTLNRQGNDVGTQYRSAIFFHSPEQEETAKKSLADTDASQLWDDPIVTKISAFTEFYPAEGYHQDYYDNNPNQPYCSLVISPKLRKFRKEFAEKLKK